MKKSVMLAVAAAALAVSTAGCAQPGYNNYHNRGYSNNNGWNYAAAALGGAVVGGIIGAIVNQPAVPVYGQVYGGYMPPPVYAPVEPRYVPAPAYSPGWQQRCDNAQTLPVVDAYGRVISYTLTCR